MRFSLSIVVATFALVFFAGNLFAQTLPPPGSPIGAPFPTPIALKETELGDPTTAEDIPFPLPGPVVPGYVVLLEPAPSGVNPQDPRLWSDIIEFNQNLAFFHSDPDNGALPDPTIIDLVTHGNTVYLPEDRLSITYETPGTTYFISSDVEVPEPAALLILASSAIVMLRRRSCRIL